MCLIWFSQHNFKIISNSNVFKTKHLVYIKKMIGRIFFSKTKENVESGKVK